jgi:ubiquinone/menaquinone biosynthesis C-methylase UbiE
MTKRIWEKFWERFFKENKDKICFGKVIFDYSKPDRDIVQLVKLFKKEKVKNILDIGCGEGRNCRYLAQKGFNVTGIDISKLAIKIARKKAKQSNLKIKYIVGDMKKLPSIFPENYFDAVISTQTIFHGTIKDIRKTIEGIRKVTKNGGLVFVTLQPVRGNEYRMGKKIEKGTYISYAGEDKGEIHHFFTKEEIKKEFKKFKILKIFLNKNSNYWYCLFRNQK